MGKWLGLGTWELGVWMRSTGDGEDGRMGDGDGLNMAMVDGRPK